MTCILLLLLLIQCKILLYLGPVRPVRCFVIPVVRTVSRLFIRPAERQGADGSATLTRRLARQYVVF